MKYLLKYFLITLLTAVLLLFFRIGTSQEIPSGQNDEFSDSDWSTNTIINQLSTDGKWVIYIDVFPDKQVTYLQHTSDKIKLSLGGIKYSSFSKNSTQLALLNTNNEFIMIDLKTQFKKVITNVSYFELSSSGKFIALIQGDLENSKKQLLIVNLQGEIVHESDSVEEFTWHPSLEKLAFISGSDTNSNVFTYDILSETKTGILKNMNFQFSALKWSDDGNAFLVHGNNSLFYYRLNKKVEILDQEFLARAFPCYEISKYGHFLSDDAESVYFYRNKISNPNDESKDIHVWKSSDPWNLPRMEQYQERALDNLLTLWNPEQSKLYEVASAELPDVRLSPSPSVVLLSNSLQYEPQYNISQESDVYLKNIFTGEKQLLIEKQNNTVTYLSFSEGGRYIAYFNRSDWYIYDSERKIHTNLTGKKTQSFAFSYEGYSEKLGPHGNPGWTSDGKLILYDEFDIWLFSPEGTLAERITKGRENKTVYRISTDSYFNANPTSTPRREGKVYDVNDLIVEVYDENFNTGYGLLSKNKKFKPLIHEPLQIRNILISKDKNVIVYTKSRYDLPFAVYAYNRNEDKETLLYQSNPRFQKEEEVGKSETIFYQSESGKKLKASLIYPSDFDPAKKYPMVVWIYEGLSENVLHFNPPHDFNPNGFNVLKYTTNGYFVLLPDIKYKIGQPGISALDCLMAAVKQASQTPSVDMENIGLIGHSFGGYETAYIATQTNLFKTVVAGAGIYDFRSAYHDIQWYGWNLENSWRFENQQLRMGGSYYELKEQYENNSPLSHVENLNTPMLLWTGKEDSQVHWSQSIYFFNAMKRLHKAGELLLLDKEDHTITKPENQRLLTRYIFDWFEKYLK